MSRESRAAQIRDCAVAVFAAEGIGHANHAQVAAAAGVALPTLFYHYPDHAALKRAVVAKVSHFLLDAIGRSAIAEGAGGLCAIERILIRLARSLDEQPELAAIWLDWSTARSDDVWPEYLAFHETAQKLVKPLIHRAQADGDADSGVDAADAARVVVGMAHMVSQMYLTQRHSAEIDDAIHRLVRGYFNAR
ncbi:MAG: TetR/AcrR family transcriptional regulator [Novosphingobium sp.]